MGTNSYITLNAGTGGSLLATETNTIAGTAVEVQRVKLWGADGNAADTGPSNPLPVEIKTDLPLVATTDGVRAALACDKLMQGSAEVTPTCVYAAYSGTNDTAVVTGTASTYISVLAMVITQGNADEVVTFKSNTSTIAAFDVVAKGMLVLPFNPFGWFKTTTAADTLNVDLTTGSVGTKITVCYVKVT
jgi:hypothetical protein